VSELKRRLVHASGTGLPVLYLLDWLPWEYVVSLLVFGSLVAGVLEILRLYVGLDWAIYDELTREYEQDNPAGYAFYMFSQTAVALLFRPEIAIPGMLMLTIGDPISGILSSNRVSQTKRLTTLAAMFVVCFVLAWPFVRTVAPSPAVAVVASGVGALGATVADGFKPVVAGYVVDDNASIPPMASVGIWVVLALA
jgi:dolichol kinase